MEKPLSVQQLVGGLRTPECLRWHDGYLWFSDIFDDRVYRTDLSGNLELIAEFDDHPAGLAFLPDGSLIIALVHSLRLVRRDRSGVLSEYASLADFGAVELNDLVGLPDGRIYAGNVATPKEKHVEGRPSGNGVVVVMPDGVPRLVATEGIVRPNGLAVAASGDLLIVADTPGRKLVSYPIEADGGLGAPSVWADVAPAAPDGICVDAEGAVWLASPYTRETLRVLPGGEVTHRIPSGSEWSTCVTLGGPDRRTLFVTSWAVEVGPNPTIARMDTAAGRISVGQAEVPGAGWP
jgi:sugar lactone lactonase YvrE